MNYRKIISKYYQKKIDEIKVPKPDLSHLANKKITKKPFFKPVLIYALVLILIITSPSVSQLSHPGLDTQLMILTEEYELMTKIEKGLKNFNKIMSEYYGKGDKE